MKTFAQLTEEDKEFLVEKDPARMCTSFPQYMVLNHPKLVVEHCPEAFNIPSYGWLAVNNPDLLGENIEHSNWSGAEDALAECNLKAYFKILGEDVLTEQESNTISWLNSPIGEHWTGLLNAASYISTLVPKTQLTPSPKVSKDIFF